MTKKLSDYEVEGFDGNDASLEISLFEYGLIWKLDNDEYQAYKFIYGVETDNSGNYTKFEFSFMTKNEFERLQSESWFKLNEVLSYSGTDCLTFPEDIQTCLQYYGYQNIFGSEPTLFTIENPDNE
jgi:hypothetical protein